jgi:hypothetical protein
MPHTMVMKLQPATDTAMMVVRVAPRSANRAIGMASVAANRVKTVPVMR